MSVEALGWAFAQPLPANEKLVLLALANCENAHTQVIVPGQERIAVMASMSVRSVQRMLSKLEERGLVLREHRYDARGKRTSDTYQLAVAGRELGDNLSGSENTTTRQKTGDNLTRVAGKREENQREKKARETLLPADWSPTDEHRARAQRAGLNLDREVERFRLHAETHDRRAVRWNGAFTTWLMNAEERKVVPFPMRAPVPSAPRYKTPEEVEAARLAAIEKSKQGSIQTHPEPTLPYIPPKPTKIDPWA